MSLARVQVGGAGKHWDVCKWQNQLFIFSGRGASVQGKKGGRIENDGACHKHLMDCEIKTMNLLEAHEINLHVCGRWKQRSTS